MGKTLAALPPTLRALDLSGNALDGLIDGQLFSGGDICASLRYLSLAASYLSVPIPASLSRRGFLLPLNLSGNRLSGEPDFAGGLLPLRRLRVLDLSRNDLSGPVPEGIGNLHNLKTLYLNGNRFTGPVSAGLGLCPHLAELDLSGNSFSGALSGPLQWLSSLFSTAATSSGTTTRCTTPRRCRSPSQLRSGRRPNTSRCAR